MRNKEQKEKEKKDAVLERRRAYARHVTARKLKELAEEILPPGILPKLVAEVDLRSKQMRPIADQMGRPVLSILCGSIFGDASLGTSSSVEYDPATGLIYAKKRGENTARVLSNAKFRFTFKHSTRQSDWFFWKVHILRRYIPNDTAISFLPPDSKQISAVDGSIHKLPGELLGKWLVQSPHSADITSLHKILYKGKAKVIKRSWLNHMDHYFLMTLWLDDGSLMNQVQGSFCLNSTPIEELEILSDYINKAWGLQTSVSSKISSGTITNPDPHQIQFKDMEDLKTFLLLIAGIIPVKSMLYKVCFYDRDTAKRQRWTDELKGRVRKDWHSYLDEYYLGLAALQDKDQEIDPT